MLKHKSIFYLILIIAEVALLTASLIFTDWFFILSLIMIGISMFPTFNQFEKRNVEAEEVILIAVLSALGAIARVPFASIPSVQPTSFIIMMTGILFGGEIGFLVGAITALASNLLLGQGPWTPWQMFAWSMMGLSSGYFFTFAHIKPSLSFKIFAFLWGFIFGWLMNLWAVVSFFGGFTLKALATSIIGSFYFDLAHGIGNVLFIQFFYTHWYQILSRVRIKYGLLK